LGDLCEILIKETLLSN